MAITTQVNNDLYKRALSEAERERIANLVIKQGAVSTPASRASTVTPSAGGAVTGATIPTGQTIYQQMVAQQGGGATGQIGAQGMQQMGQKAQQRAQVMSSGDTQAINQYLINEAKQKSAGNDVLGPQVTPQMKDYLVFGDSNPDFKVGMDDYERSKWDAISQKYEAGDQSWLTDTNDFRNAGNWSGYYGDDGGYNGWVRAVNGIGGYAPVFGGTVGETGYAPGTLFYSPDGTAWTMGQSGKLLKSGTVDVHKYGSYIGPKAGYQDSTFWRLEDDGTYKKYSNSTAPDDVLEAAGYYRDQNGLVMPISTNENYWTQKAIKNGEITPEQIAMAQIPTAGKNIPDNILSSVPSNPNPGGTNPSGTQPTPVPQGETINNPITGMGNTKTITPVTQSGSTPTETAPTGTTPTETTGTTRTASGNPYQAYLDQWDYPEAPEWTGTEYETKRDEALKRAEDMRWGYNPDTDPVWQAYQKQYRREGDRATQEALAQASMRTGGLANSYAATAAAQAGNYYASQLSDKIPKLYQDAYNRYLQEFQRQLGISDQYEQQGRTEYERYLDRLGKYNTDRSFDYGRYRDAVGDYRYNDETAYNRAWNEDERDWSRAWAEDEKNYNRNRDAIADEKWWAQFNRQNFESDRAYEQALIEYADAQGWKSKEWDFMLQQYGDQMTQWEKEFALKQKQLAMEQEQMSMQAAENAKGWEYKNKVLEYEMEQDAYNNQTAESKYNDAMQMEALDYLRANGIVTGIYAEILGVPDGTTYEQYYSRYLGGGSSGGAFEDSEIANPGYTGSGGGTYSGSGYSGGGSGSGNGYSGGGSGSGSSSGEEGGGDETTATPRYNIVGKHSNGKDKTSGYNLLAKELALQVRSGYSASRIRQTIYQWASQGRIADWEIPIIMNELGLDIQSSASSQNPNNEGRIRQYTK